MDNINKNLSLCKKGKHKIRINKCNTEYIYIGTSLFKIEL